MNRQSGKEMHVYLVKYHVYEQLKADEDKADLNRTMPQFDESGNTVRATLRHFENGYWNISVFICCHKLSAFILALLL